MSNDPDTLRETEAYLHLHIPITAKMGFRLVAYDRSSIRIKAPLAANLNHRHTAFGGSISTLGILAGWTLLHLYLKESGIRNRLVIKTSNTEFISAIRDDFEAVARAPEASALETFRENLLRFRKARLKVDSEILCGETHTASHAGVYVALLQS